MRRQPRRRRILPYLFGVLALVLALSFGVRALRYALAHRRTSSRSITSRRTNTPVPARRLRKFPA